jgi:hypothetical protein
MNDFRIRRGVPLARPMDCAILLTTIRLIAMNDFGSVGECRWRAQRLRYSTDNNM